LIEERRDLDVRVAIEKGELNRTALLIWEVIERARDLVSLGNVPDLVMQVVGIAGSAMGFSDFSLSAGFQGADGIDRASVRLGEKKRP
jgi:hypothetical protein